MNSMITDQKLDQSDLVYWVYKSSCLCSCAASRASQPTGSFFGVAADLVPHS